MAKHNEILNSFKLAIPHFDFSDKEHKSVVCTLLMHDNEAISAFFFFINKVTVNISHHVLYISFPLQNTRLII